MLQLGEPHDETRKAIVQNRPNVRRIAPAGVSRLKRLAPPAGYVILIQDVAYGNRFKIARHQQLDRNQIKRGADFPFETRVTLILEAADAVAAERDLHDELALARRWGNGLIVISCRGRGPAQPANPALNLCMIWRAIALAAIRCCRTRKLSISALRRPRGRDEPPAAGGPPGGSPPDRGQPGGGPSRAGPLCSACLYWLASSSASV